jgi:hypothetical protein
MVDSDYDPDAAPGLLTPPVTWKVSSHAASCAKSAVTVKLVEEFNPSLSRVNE